jgi:cell volume regulation protein A
LTSQPTQGVLVYEIIFMLVVFSVLVQGGLVTTVARLYGITMRPVEPRPWSLGLRLSDQPDGAHRYHVTPGAPADGRTVGELHLGDELWISLIVRDGQAIPVTAHTSLLAGDEVLLLTDPTADTNAGRLFSAED